jgi:predicted tellurium resistance membrane protein TerC
MVLMSEWFTLENGIALLTLTALEVVLGIDNIVFISIVSQDLPADQQPSARRLGLVLAMAMRIALLLAIGWIMGLSAALFSLFGHEVSGRDLILLVGGLFLIGKATVEIHAKTEGHGGHGTALPGVKSLRAALVQIVLLDVVFSLDSVITAVGMARHIAVMIAAVVIAVGIMIALADPISRFINLHPALKMLALSFLVLIGVVLVADGIGMHINKGYVYFAMAFSLAVEMLNIRVRAARGRRAAR